MTARSYSASLSQSQGRSGYSIIFRHPVRCDNETGKPGLRVRRGLRTRDKAVAERLRDEFNKLLAAQKYHNQAAREEAERRFDPLVVNIFFDKIVPEELNFSDLRDEVIPLPPRKEPDGYRHVLLLGTTGAGKTTLVRQLIGTDRKERFPSTSPGKTTTHDTEIILDDGPWRAVVTFVSRDEALEYLNECISKAVLMAYKNSDNAEVLRCLLRHVNQRFRFNYILGNGPRVPENSSDFDDDEEEEFDEDAGLFSPEESDAIDLSATNELLEKKVEQLRELAQRLGNGLRTELDVRDEEENKRILEELFEDDLNNRLRDDETFYAVADDLMDEIEKRFELLPPGITNPRQGWPLTWTGEWPDDKRDEFLKSISLFSSNYAPLYGRLLTPLVNGIRVAGPFSPKWWESGRPKLVLLDGEGLGHTPKSSSSVSTGVSRRIEAADAVLLVDNATQPMQAASLAAIRKVVTTGNGRKLILAFTHFDEIKGDNLPKVKDKVHHVRDSVENVIAAFGEELGLFAERILRKCIKEACFFLADLQLLLSVDTSRHKRTVNQLRELLEAIDQIIEKPQLAKASPVYDRMNLGLAIHEAARAFHGTWRPLLGLESRPGFAKEHWTRIKALNRRLATMGKDEYDSLRPVADLLKELVERIYVFIQSPLYWENFEPSDDEKQNIYDTFANSLELCLLNLAIRRVWKDRISGWELAYRESGKGSTFRRAEIIGNNIYDPAAPIPDATPSPDRNQFLREVVVAVEDAAKEVEAKIQ